MPSSNSASSTLARPIVVAAAIIVKEGLVFAARRGPGKHLAGMWEFPGGKLEDGESPEHCLQRELYEEFGIETRVGPLVGKNTHDYGSKLVQLLAFHVEHIRGDFELRDHDELAWLDPEHLLTIDWAPADVPLAEQYLATFHTQTFYSGQAPEYCEESSQFETATELDRFLELIPPKGRILDAGCGSGRDAKAFTALGHRVTAFDCNADVADWASAYTGLSVQVRSFTEVDEKETYDGVWASASLLHVPIPLLDEALKRLSSSLKRGGVIYMSFKEGDGATTDARDRTFTNLSISGLTEQIGSIEELELIDVWSSESQLRGHPQRWTNAFARKSER